jgi:zinc protease
MGYLADIKDYPNQYDYAWQFFNRFYRPENTTIVVVGDIKQPEVLQMVKKYWGDWKPRRLQTANSGRTGAERSAQQAYRMGFANLPICDGRLSRSGFFRNRKRQSRARFAERNRFRRKLRSLSKTRLKEQKAFSSRRRRNTSTRNFSPLGAGQRRERFELRARRNYQNLQTLFDGIDSAKQLDETRSRMRYGFAMAMNSNDAIAGTLARSSRCAARRKRSIKFSRFTIRSRPKTFKMAEKYFKDNSQTVVTLATKKGGAK